MIKKKKSKYFFRVCVATVSRLILHNQQVLTIFKGGSQKLNGRNIARWMLSAFLRVILKPCGETSNIFEVGSRSI